MWLVPVFETLYLGIHYCDVIMGAMASHVTSLTIVYSTVYSGTDQRKHQSSASLAFVWGIHRWPVNFPPKGPVTRIMFPFDDVIMDDLVWRRLSSLIYFLLGMPSWFALLISNHHTCWYLVGGGVGVKRRVYCNTDKLLFEVPCLAW